MGAPAPPEHLPFGFLAAGEYRSVLDFERLAARRRHLAQHPFAERLAADQDHLPAGGVVAHRIEHALQARTVPADRRAAELLDIGAVGLGIDAVAHQRKPATASMKRFTRSPSTLFQV